MKYIKLIDNRNRITPKPLTKKQVYQVLNPSLQFQKTKEDIKRHTTYADNLLKKLYNTDNVEELEIYIHTWGSMKNEQGKIYITSKSNKRKVISCYLNNLKWILDDIIHLEHYKHMEDTIKEERKEIKKILNNKTKHSLNRININQIEFVENSEDPEGKTKEDLLYSNKTANNYNKTMNKMVEINLENHLTNHVDVKEELRDWSNYIPGLTLTKINRYDKTTETWNETYSWRRA